MVGRETAFGGARRELVLGGTLSLPQLIARMSSAPAPVFSLPPATLRPGAPAGGVVLDVTTPSTADPAAFLSKSPNTPVSRRARTGSAVLTPAGATIVHSP